MTTLELVEKLAEFEIVDGFGIRDGMIVVWVNEFEVPETLLEFVALDVTE